MAIEDDDYVSSNIADVAILALTVQSNSVRPLQSSNAPNRFAGLRIHNLDARAMRQVEQVCLRISGEVIPAAVSADLSARLNLVGAALIGSSGGVYSSERQQAARSYADAFADVDEVHDLLLKIRRRLCHYSLSAEQAC